MKHLLVLLAAVMTLTGCQTIQDTWDYYDMARFDNNEYMLANKVRTQANLGARKCGTPAINQEVSVLWANTLELKTMLSQYQRMMKQLL